LYNFFIDGLENGNIDLDFVNLGFPLPSKRHAPLLAFDRLHGGNCTFHQAAAAHQRLVGFGWDQPNPGRVPYLAQSPVGIYKANI
jgi:hypothetical protein